jgi:hypothetical protein
MIINKDKIANNCTKKTLFELVNFKDGKDYMNNRKKKFFTNFFKNIYLHRKKHFYEEVYFVDIMVNEYDCCLWAARDGVLRCPICIKQNRSVFLC